MFDIPTVKCLDDVGKKVWFKLRKLNEQGPNGQGQGGNGEVASDVLVAPDYTTGTYSLRYGLYYDTEDLVCPPVADTNGRYYYNDRQFYAKRTGNSWTLYKTSSGEAVTNAVPQGDATPPTSFTYDTQSTATIDNSCNKVFYNLAINIAHLGAQGLQGCAFEWAASAVEAGDVGDATDTFNANGDFTDTNGVYAGIEFLGIYLTGQDDSGQGGAVALQRESPQRQGELRADQLHQGHGHQWSGAGGHKTDYWTDGTVDRSPLPSIRHTPRHA